jgi:hypothetical protein
LRVKKWFCALVASCLLLGTAAMPAVAAVKLPVETAAAKSFIYAKHSCAHDFNCVRYGVRNCNRQSLHVVLCRIYLDRSTQVQGNYTCQKLVRIALDPITYRVLVTGNGPYHCA